MLVGLLLNFFSNQRTKANINDACWVVLADLFIGKIGIVNNSFEKNGKNNLTGMIESQLVATLVWSFIVTLMFIC